MDSQYVYHFSLARVLMDQFPDCRKYFTKYVEDSNDTETVESFNNKMIGILKNNKMVQYGIKVD